MYPRFSWMTFSREVAPNAPVAPLFLKNVAVTFVYLEQGSVSWRWISQGEEIPAQGEAGFIRMHPADGHEHVAVGRAGIRGMRFSALLVPTEAFEALAVADGLVQGVGMRVAEWPNDMALRKALSVLVSPPAPECADQDEAARSLVLRVAHLMGQAAPSWTKDQRGFDGSTLRNLIDSIDANLRAGPTATDMATLCGLSPTHFASKFQRSVGMSLHRFVNRRRIRASLDLLKSQTPPLAQVSLDLGFSSQSHFTRIFSGVMGISPAKFRRQYRPTRG